MHAHTSILGSRVCSAAGLQRSFLGQKALSPSVLRRDSDYVGFAGFEQRRRSYMYARALQLAREEEVEAARKVFAALTVLHPEHHKAWVSWAQLEKRSNPHERFLRCREVLQRGLTLNPGAVALIQAWGLMELQRGNFLAAVMLLERCAQQDPARCSPVLRWKPVVDAQRSVSSRRRRGSAQRTAATERSVNGEA